VSEWMLISVKKDGGLVYISFCSMINIQILNCQRCFDGVFSVFAKNLL
jgi:hypothetical protein